jgi:hypothetical protein
MGVITHANRITRDQPAASISQIQLSFAAGEDKARLVKKCGHRQRLKSYAVLRLWKYISTANGVNLSLNL